MFEHGSYAEMMDAVFSPLKEITHFESFQNMISRLTQYQRGKCNCESNQCIYNAEQPLETLPADEKKKYCTLYEYDLIDEENKIIYQSFTFNNNNDIIPLADLINFTPTFARLAIHVVDLIENHNILHNLLQDGKNHGKLSESNSSFDFNYDDLFVYEYDPFATGNDPSERKFQLCLDLERFYYQFHGYIIDYTSELSMKELQRFILDDTKNKSGSTVENSLVLIHSDSDGSRGN
jgi:hypothetical protein